MDETTTAETAAQVGDETGAGLPPDLLNLLRNPPWATPQPAEATAAEPSDVDAERRRPAVSALRTMLEPADGEESAVTLARRCLQLMDSLPAICTADELRSLANDVADTWDRCSDALLPVYRRSVSDGSHGPLQKLADAVEDWLEFVESCVAAGVGMNPLTAEDVPRLSAEERRAVDWWLIDEEIRGREVTGKPDGAGSTVDETTANYSPVLDAASFLRDLLMPNWGKGRSPPSDQTITRRKKQWGAEFVAGSNRQSFRFCLETLRAQGVTYPAGWNSSATETPPSATS